MIERTSWSTWTILVGRVFQASRRRAADEILAFASMNKLVADGGSAVDPTRGSPRTAIDGARRLAKNLQLVTNGCIEADATTPCSSTDWSIRLLTG